MEIGLKKVDISFNVSWGKKKNQGSLRFENQSRFSLENLRERFSFFLVEIKYLRCMREKGGERR